jgi:hypothetical protein
MVAASAPAWSSWWTALAGLAESRLKTPKQEAPVRNRITKRLRTTAVLSILALALLAAGPATAQSVEDPWQWNTVSLFDLAPDTEPTLVVRGLLKEGLEPPIQVALPVPPGSDIIWAGAISGSDPSLDQELPYAVEEGDEYDLVSLELTGSPVAQLEVGPPEGWVSDEESVRTVSMTWVSAFDLDKALLTFGVPVGYEATAVVPAAAPQVQQDGSSVVSVETSPVAFGQTLELSGEISRGTGATDPQDEAVEALPAQPVQETGTQDSGDSNDTVRILIALALVAGVIIIAVVVFRYASSGGSAEDDEDDFDDDAPEPE